MLYSLRIVVVSSFGLGLGFCFCCPRARAIGVLSGDALVHYLCDYLYIFDMTVYHSCVGNNDFPALV